MPMTSSDTTMQVCPSCGGPTQRDEVNLAIWHNTRLVVIRDVPAMVCPACGEQLYEQATNDAILELTNAGFPRSAAWEEIVVPVYRIPPRQPADDGFTGAAGVRLS
jgi:YgiT-type zinc finger domain-containing protein